MLLYLLEVISIDRYIVQAQDISSKVSEGFIYFVDVLRWKYSFVSSYYSSILKNAER